MTAIVDWAVALGRFQAAENERQGRMNRLWLRMFCNGRSQCQGDHK